MNDLNITNEKQYDKALAQIYVLMQTHPEVNTPKGRKLNELLTLVERYEAEHYPMTKNK